MPQKTHRQTSGALTRHSRSTSGGSSKMGLNLHFTQKDPPPPKHQDKAKKNGHVHDAMAAPPFPRLHSGIQTTLKEHTNQKRPHASSSRHPDVKQKTGFTISSPGEDEDEWVSSEAGSGAATPDDSSDEEEPSRERSITPVKEAKTAPAFEKDGIFVAATPRAESSMSRVATARPTAASEAPLLATVKHVPTDRPNHYSNEQLTHRRQHTEPNIMESRSGTTSPTHHHRHDSSKRHSMTRPPSMHSIRSEAPLRPHPLIRGNSHGQGAVVGSTTKPVPLAPLTVTSGTSAAQMSPSPPDSSCSPTSIAFGLHSPNRRTSFSSARSVATLPMTPMSPQPNSKQHPDRHRTLSNISSSSTSFAALTSLAHLPASTSRPPTPLYSSHFPQPNPHANLDTMHPLLPPPYLGAHLTVLATKSPVRESFDRVVRAKQGI